jgi:DNA-binding HxlR family transcriptional regulator
MAALNRKEPLKMSDLIPLFKNDISERTLRNELQAMVKNGLIKKSGVNKATTYFKV